MTCFVDWFLGIALDGDPENFFAQGIFLPKTCCTNMTILYNYEQVEPGNWYGSAPQHILKECLIRMRVEHGCIGKLPRNGSG